MSSSYLNRARSAYFQPWTDGHYCIGNNSECDHFKDIAKRIGWGKVPDRGDRSKIKRLRFLPTPAQVKKCGGLPDYVTELQNLEFLEIPFPFLEELSTKRFPKGLRGLLVANRVEFNELLGKRVIRWPHDLVLPELAALLFMGEYESATVWPQLELDSGHLPKLEYLNSDVDSKGRVLEGIERFASLKHLELYSVRGFDVLDHVPGTLSVLHINSAARTFPFEKIVKHTGLAVVQLLHVRAEIDCELFASLPNLVELNLYGCKKLKNVMSLLKCERLRSLELTDCGNPLTREGRSELEQRGLDRLEIRYA
jgi:hypothetical protein